MSQKHTVPLSWGFGKTRDMLEGLSNTMLIRETRGYSWETDKEEWDLFAVRGADYSPERPDNILSDVGIRLVRDDGVNDERTIRGTLFTHVRTRAHDADPGLTSENLGFRICWQRT